ncbi:MAG TPA: heavy metal translocating P-type ATPase metal-binding domain-containing protein [Fluviicola sp.]|nr:heavy metal translocating P-type ATPase metal-binding domain-containing protein [Fluviicola sp.]
MRTDPWATAGTTTVPKCYHCGEDCMQELVRYDDHEFCCNGCKAVYDLLKTSDLCTYYEMGEAPGKSPVKEADAEKFAYLDHESVYRRIVRFDEGSEVHVVFYLPAVHCSSCIWLLEHLQTLHKGILHASVNFLRREVTIVFNKELISLPEVAALLTAIGYEPLIHLDSLEKPEKKKSYRKILQIGIAGFCFGNSMMLSFPEYFSDGQVTREYLGYLFGYLNLGLALPVFFYSASGFFVSAWKSIRHRHLNIDAPIALAILVTFLRSVYEIISHTGAGYIDSMTGIVFFMLIGRYFQDKTYATLSFERDYRSYFPVGVTVRKKNGKTESVPVSALRKGDRMIVRSNEIIPADSQLVSTATHVDYSFITGESVPVRKAEGDLIYAGGRQLEGAVELEVVQPVSQSYLTRLWNKGRKSENGESYVDAINLWFTVIVLNIAVGSSVYWLVNDGSKALDALTAVLIVACPCGLLLTSTFANGNILRVLGRNRFYLRDAQAIDKLAKTDTLVFDKTGTITRGAKVEFVGNPMTHHERQLIASLAGQSSHPLSRMIHAHLSDGNDLPLSEFREFPGKGIRALAGESQLLLGSAEFITGKPVSGTDVSSKVFLMIDNRPLGYFRFANAYREGLGGLVKELKSTHVLKVLSGDNDAERSSLEQLFGSDTHLMFNRLPEEKREYVGQLQDKGHNVAMIGDGLNDAGALLQSDMGISVSDDTNTFSPACDAILDGKSFTLLPKFIRMAKSGKKIIVATFILSLIYNLTGLFFAVQGTLSPVVAAILMPASSISIVVLTTVATRLTALRLKL